jgi:hypothetical protein
MTRAHHTRLQACLHVAMDPSFLLTSPVAHSPSRGLSLLVAVVLFLAGGGGVVRADGDCQGGSVSSPVIMR